jgi:hypothetical protein
MQVGSYYFPEVGAPLPYKVKVKVFLCLTKHHAMKIYWGMEV